MWEFEHLTSRPGNPKSNAKSESAIRNSKNLLDKVLDNRGAIDSTKISGNFGPKLNGSVPFEVDHFSRSEFWLNGSCPTFNGYKPRIESIFGIYLFGRRFEI